MSIYAIASALSMGLLFGIMALGVFVDFRILRFPDLTIEGSFALGACVAVASIRGGIHPLVATALGTMAGGLAGYITGFLTSKLRVPPVVAGILVMSASYSGCLIALHGPNVAIDPSATIFAPLDRWQAAVGSMSLAGMAVYPALFLALLLAAKWLLDRFLCSERGIELRAAGSNVLMAASQCVDPDAAVRRGLLIANCMVGLCGALFAQKERFADVNMGFGILIAGLASVFIGQGVEKWFGAGVAGMSFAVVLGALAHRLSIASAYEVGLRTEYFNAFTSVIVLAAVCLPNVRDGVRQIVRRSI